MLSRYGNLDPNATAGQNSAFDSLRSTISGMPDFSSMFSGGIDKLMNTSTQPQQDMMTGAYGDLQKNLGGVARGDFLDPYSSPGMTGWLDTLSGDITDRVKGTYAASGRDPSGAGSFAGSLSRGLGEGLAPVIANQANRNRSDQMSAAGTLFGGGQSTAQGTAALGQLPIQNMIQGMGQLPAWMQSILAPGQANLNLANQQAAIPWGNMAQLLGGATGLGSLGQESSGTATQTTPQSTMGNILGGASTAAALLPMFFSDERLKTDIHPVGMLDDGETNIYSYRYKGDPRTQIGLIAQEIQETRPDAVAEVGGYLAVDYSKATERARMMRGMLDLEAA